MRNEETNNTTIISNTSTSEVQGEELVTTRTFITETRENIQEKIDAQKAIKDSAEVIITDLASKASGAGLSVSVEKL